MDRSATMFPTAIPRRPSLGNDASTRSNGATLSRQYQPYQTRPQYPTTPPGTDDGKTDSSNPAVDRARLKELNCERRRPEEESEDKSRLANMPSTLVGQAVTPFLKEHVPNLYAPVSKIEASYSRDSSALQKNFNSKYCYRHRPDSKCRKAADEDKMAMIQTVCFELVEIEVENNVANNDLDRNWKSFPRPISKPSPTSGVFSLPHLPSIGSS